MLNLNKLGEINNCDWLSNRLPDKSVDLIIADPPYFEIKGDFDFVWKSFDDYLISVEEWAVERKRVLSDRGSLLWWGHAKRIAYTQIILDKYFNLENSLIWEKTDSIQYQFYSIPLSRKFNTHNERLLFYSNDLEFKKSNNPFSKYLRSEFKLAKITNQDVSKLFPSRTGGLTGRVFNWLKGATIITKKQYLKIRDYTNNEYLRKEYEELRKEHEELRRPFNNSYKLTDVLRASQESYVSNRYDHETIKPLVLTKKLIKVTTRDDSIVLIPFGGSGTEVEACIANERKYFCYEINEKYYTIIRERERKALENKRNYIF